MVANKHISKIIVVVMAAAVLLCFLAIGFSGTLAKALGGTAVTMEYESKLFDTDEVIRIDIQMDESEWETMLANAISEEYYVCDVVINGKKIKNVAIRPKGNTSLSAIAMDPETDRFSMKLEFDHFVEGQTCWGLDKLILNNNYADATNMKEAVIYDMYGYLGANASLYNYAEVSVNGEYWGVYLALEGVEESFMLRNFGTQDGELYKPDSMEMGGGGKSDASPGMSMPDTGDFNPSDFAGMTPPSGGAGGFPFGGSSGSDQGGAGAMPSFGGFSGGDFSFDPGNLPDGFSFDAGSMPEGFSFDSGSMPDMGSFEPSGMGGFSMGGGGANLNYNDDDLDSYSTIWEGEITGTGNADHRRVVTALKNISEGKNLEEYLNVDNVLKYMAVHTFSVNMDSLSGSMAHNYYLYEYNGQLDIFPWDYNLSFGGMSMGGSGDGTEIVNDAIDTPFSGTKFFDALLENEEYLERYHAYLQQLVEEYIEGGRFDEVYSRIRSRIDSLVESDPTAFYSYEEYQNAAQILYETVKLRAESIKGQLAGTIPSTDLGQRQNSSALIDGSHLDIEAMGHFNMGGSTGSDFEGGRSEWGRRKSGGSGEGSGASQPEAQPQTPEQDFGGEGFPGGSGFDPGSMPEGFSPGNMPGGSGSGFDPNSMPEGFNPWNMPGGAGSASQPDAQPDNPDQQENSAQENPAQNPSQSGSNRPQQSFSGMRGGSTFPTWAKNLILMLVCLLIMIAVLLFAKYFKRRR